MLPHDAQRTTHDDGQTQDTYYYLCSRELGALIIRQITIVSFQYRFAMMSKHLWIYLTRSLKGKKKWQSRFTSTRTTCTFIT